VRGHVLKSRTFDDPLTGLSGWKLSLLREDVQD